MPYHIEVIVRGSSGDHTISGPFVQTPPQADADMTKIREARKLASAGEHDEAEAALPAWLIVDPTLILSASMEGAG